MAARKSVLFTENRGEFREIARHERDPVLDLRSPNPFPLHPAVLDADEPTGFRTPQSRLVHINSPDAAAAEAGRRYRNRRVAI